MRPYRYMWVNLFLHNISHGTINQNVYFVPALRRELRSVDRRAITSVGRVVLMHPQFVMLISWARYEAPASWSSESVSQLKSSVRLSRTIERHHDRNRLLVVSIRRRIPTIRCAIGRRNRSDSRLHTSAYPSRCLENMSKRPCQSTYVFIMPIR